MPEVYSRRTVAPLLERRHEVETPEHVALSFELAGPGSRFAAFLYDGLLVVGLITGVFIGAVLLLMMGLPPAAGTILAAVVLLAVFCIAWGYFVWFEGMREGQTPGKRKLGLRVVHEGGHPLTLRGAAIRNLIRFVDVQPLPSCLLGGAFILLHPRAQRLGDMAAGTLVVRERTVPSLPEEAASAGPPRLADSEYDVLHEYALRRATLERERRKRVAGKLAPHFARYLPPRGVGGHLLDPDNALHADSVLMMVYADESGRRAGAGARAGSGSPAAGALLRRQRGTWAEYDRLLGRARAARLTNLPEAEVARFAALYREVAADLARARTYGASPELLYTLERAVAAGHNLLYSPTPRSLLRLWRWLRRGFPALVRRRATPILVAALLLFGPGAVTFTAIARDPGRARTIVPAAIIANAERDVERQAQGRGYNEVPELLMPLFSSQIITNNVQVTFLAFAGGILAGLGTVLILLFNGVHLGGVFGLYHAEGLSLFIWTFALPHGVLELTAICIAGGAGLWLGSALVLPGRRTRRSALVERSRDAVALLGGAVVLLILAGVIEGFISPSLLPAPLKLGFGVLTGLVLFPYLLRAGRTGSADAGDTGDAGDAGTHGTPEAATLHGGV